MEKNVKFSGKDEKALRNNQDKFRNFFKIMDDGAAICELVRDSQGRVIDYRFLEVNPAFERHTGFAPEVVAGRLRSELNPIRDERMLEACTSVVETGEPARLELYYERLGRWFEIGMFPLGGDQFSKLFNDITERKRTEETLRQSEARYRVLYEGLQDAFVQVDMEGRIIQFNDLYCQMLGYSPDELRQLTYQALTPERWQEFEASIVREQVIPRGYSDVYEKEYRCKDGTIIPVELRTILSRDKEGRPVAMWALIRNIMKRKQAELALLEHQRQLKLALDAGQLAPWEIDLVNGKVKHSPRLFELFGKDPVDKFDSREQWRALIHEDDRLRIVQSVEASKNGQAHHIEYRIRHSDGTIHWNESHGIPLADAQGRYIRLIGYARDITERKRAEEALQKLNETLEQQVFERTKLAEDRAKQLSRLSSELTLSEQRERHRLAEILHDHLQQLLIAAKMNCEALASRTTEKLRQTAETSIDLITRSLKVSRSLTAELSPPPLQQGRLSEALKWLAGWMQENHNLTVELKTEPEIDPEREDITVLLFQSARELLLNVVKHANVKSARLKMSCDGKNRLRVTVKDQGVGFEPSTIWEKAQSGTGFGLLSIRERVSLLGGSFKVRSKPGGGSTFSIVVPLALTKKEKEKRVEKPFAIPYSKVIPGRKFRVLLADDHRVVRQGLATMLGLHPDVEIVGEAANGKEAVELARKFNPDVILMDISMPKMDGLEATRIIRSENPGVRIIGLSMHEGDTVASEMMEAGASAYCTKDGDPDLLLFAIRGGIVGSSC